MQDIPQKKTGPLVLCFTVSSWFRTVERAHQQSCSGQDPPPGLQLQVMSRTSRLSVQVVGVDWKKTKHGLAQVEFGPFETKVGMTNENQALRPPVCPALPG